MNYSAEELEAIDATRRAEDWLPEDEDEDEEPVNEYGNPISGNSMPYCQAPDCGCPESRLCMAEGGFGSGPGKTWNWMIGAFE